MRARTRYRDDDGRLRRVQATAPTEKAAERELKAQLARRASHTGSVGELSPDSPFTQLVDVWLDDLDLEGRLAQSTRQLYERNMRKLVLPAFENYTLREITISKVDRFLKAQATKSHSRAQQSKVVLNLAFGLAVRYEAIPRNPVTGTTRLRKPPSETIALSHDQVDAHPASSQVVAADTRHTRAEAGRAARADHRHHAGHISSNRRGAGDPQVRRRCHPIPSHRADMRHDRLPNWETNVSAGSPKNVEIDSGRVGAELHGRGTAAASGGYC